MFGNSVKMMAENQANIMLEGFIGEKVAIRVLLSGKISSQDGSISKVYEGILGVCGGYYLIDDNILINPQYVLTIEKKK